MELYPVKGTVVAPSSEGYGSTVPPSRLFLGDGSNCTPPYIQRGLGADVYV